MLNNLVAVFVRKVEVVVVGVTEKQAESNQVQKGSRRVSVEVLGLVPPVKKELAKTIHKKLGIKDERRGSTEKKKDG
jgi:hypothetical protein